MVTNKLQTLLIFIYLVLFPFGQLQRIDMPFFTHFYITDLIVGISSLIFIIKKSKINVYLNKELLVFLIISSFTLVLGIVNYHFSDFNSLFYLIRLGAYIYFFFLISSTVLNNQKYSEIYVKGMFFIGLFIAIFGLIQYILIPDTRSLAALGWDDHYFRLISTFFDPTYTGILLVFSLILGFNLILSNKNILYMLCNLVIIIALALTYSRSSYLAALLSLFVFLIQKRKIKFIVFILVAFFIFLPLLPRPDGSEGVKLERTYSIFQKKDNLLSSVKIIKESPVFGIGFNTLCEYRNNREAKSVIFSNACGGLDNSFVFVLVTTGISGLISFIYLLFRVVKVSYKDTYLLPIIVGLFIHAQFTNTIFYAWVMGYLAIIFAARLNIKGYN